MHLALYGTVTVALLMLADYAVRRATDRVIAYPRQRPIASHPFNK
jgi:hypothetical protein